MSAYEHLIQKLNDISDDLNPAEFVRCFLLSYDFPRATVARLGLNESLSPEKGISVSSKIIFVYTVSENLYTKFSHVQQYIVKKQKYRFILLFNVSCLLSLDTETSEWLYTSKNDLKNHYEFFLPLIGIEKSTAIERKTVSIEIGEKFAQLFHELLVLNNDQLVQIRFTIVNLLACYLSDSLALIEPLSMQYWLSTYSEKNGSNVGKLLKTIFSSLAGVYQGPSYIECRIHHRINGLPHVTDSLQFNHDSRELLLDIASKDWAEVEPEVLGAIIQTVTTFSNSSNTFNYTSTANIYKVIGPLFMDDLSEEFENCKLTNSVSVSLLEKLENLRVFDVSCGAGNFLMVSYRELKMLERNIKSSLYSDHKVFPNKDYIKVSQFYGMDENPFAVAITRIGMLFTSIKYCENKSSGSFMLDDSPIFVGNALDMDWETILSKRPNNTFIIGNPVYKGARSQSNSQKQQMQKVFAEEISSGVKIGDLDYASAWFMKAAKYIKNSQNAFAFVTTNSLTQGVHVPTLWPMIYNQGVNISFAFTSFKWKNKGINTTAVTVVVIGCRTKNNQHPKIIYDNNLIYDADSISPYLTKGDIIVYEQQVPISPDLPKMPKGNMPYAHSLLLTPEERDSIVSIYPESQKYFKRIVGAKEFIHHLERWCLWIDDSDVDTARQIPLIADILDAVKKERLKKASCPQKLLDHPNRFREMKMPKECTLVIPAVSSENREYFQAGYVGKNVVVTNLCFTMYDAAPWIFGIIESKMHNLWVCTVCGGLETRPRYSNVLGYNTFPLPKLSEKQKKSISQAALDVIIQRERYPEMNLMQLYNNETMPKDLQYAHHLLDVVVEECYSSRGFASDQERLNSMFSLYREMKGVL